MCGHVSFSRVGCDCCTHFRLLRSVGYTHSLLFSIATRIRKHIFFLQKGKLYNFSSVYLVFVNGRTSLSIALDVCCGNVCVCVNRCEIIDHKSRETCSMLWGMSVCVCVCVVIVLISWTVFLSIRINNLNVLALFFRILCFLFVC